MTSTARRAPDRPNDDAPSLLERRLKDGSRRARPECLHRSFETQVTRRPDAPALTFGGASISYAELDARANSVAHRLVELGIGPGSLVGLFAERSARMVVGILGILKAGGAYVPLDPIYPSERVGMVLEDSAVPVLLADPSLKDRMPQHEAKVVWLDDAPSMASPPVIASRPEDLAYVIYTSGSTGRPKGVPVTHANVSRLFTATKPWFGFGPDDVWTLFHSFAFDFSVWEIWGALRHGGRLVVVPLDIGRSAEAFHKLLRDEGVTVLNQTPSAFRQLIRTDLESGGSPADLALRFVIFGGEALELQSLRPWIERHGDASPQIINMYGITETTVHVTYRPISRGDLDAFAGSSPIGRPIPDLRLYLLDRWLKPVPPGVTGEIFVGGAGVARGYLNRPGLTAERFLPDPFARQPGARMYRSGDLARRRPDGEVEYLGRADEQVKIRGFRVELGEIESALAKHPGVAEAVVVPREVSPDETRLTAYLVPAIEPAPGGSELRAWLKMSLPDYMVPSTFLALTTIPLTAHGKVDRRALPEPDDVREVVFVPPRTEAEEAVARAWSEVLGRDRIGALDDFFALGGHSLLATRVVSRLRELRGIELPVRALFEATTVAALAERLERGSRAGDGPAIERVDRGRRVPASFAQRALWFLDRLAPGEPTFHVTAAVTVRGPLDVEALRRAFAEIVRRHESLRTTFALDDGRPVQVLGDPGEFPLPTIDLADVPAADREAETARVASRELHRPFDLEAGPLVRAALVRLSGEEHAVLLTMHHIITDGWSMGVAAGELSSLYQAFSRGRPSPLPDLPVQYADFADWQRRWLSGDVRQRLLDYWMKRLDGLEPLDLPTDRPRPIERSSQGASVFFTLPKELNAKVEALSRREGVTPYMTLLAAFQTLLHRSSGQVDIAVGSPIAGRNRAEFEGIIGYFVNMLVLRCDLSGDPTFRDLLSLVKETALGAYEHQDLPFDQLVEALKPPRDPSRSPLFQVMFVLQNNRMPVASKGGLSLDSLRVDEGPGTAKFDLSLALEESDGALVGSFEYRTDLFDQPTISAMVDRLACLLKAAVDEPETRISRLPLGPTPPPMAGPVVPIADLGVHELFEKQALATPDGLALAWDGGTLSYAELNVRANRLANRLRARGVVRGSFVGVALERRPELAVALLAVLKAGGAFVPLDTGFPRERLARTLEDARAKLAITRGDLLETATALLHLDADAEAIERQPGGDLSPIATLDDPAYVLYTSGSTGTPKGAIVSHRGLVNHNLAAIDLFGLAPGDRVGQVASVSFDIALEEMFPAWVCGATVVQRPDDAVLDPVRFLRWVADERITVLDLPTSYWHVWVEALDRLGLELPETLRLVVVGGEAALPAAYATWKVLAGDRVRWINTYGPTETSIIATAFEPRDTETPDALPIGRPIANVRAMVLDEDLRPVAQGLPGELFLAGECVGGGYVGRRAMTAERFLPDPSSPRPGARMFRTGDRVRVRRDGQIEFLGRVDRQVKVRGFRVEPGDVETALMSHPEISAAIVVARKDDLGENRLDAYFVARNEASAAELRAFLGKKLPRHLIPSTITPLEALPMTLTGKIDRRALPPPQEQAGSSGDSVAPRDEVERRLAAIWGEVLDVASVGVTESFFDLGGHSLAAVRLTARIAEAFGRELPLASLFLGATIADQAARLREVPTGDEPWSPLVPIQPEGQEPPFFCVHPAGGIVYCFRELAMRLAPDRPFFGLQAAGLDGTSPPLNRLEDMAASYVEAIRRHRPEGPYHLGGWSLGGLVAFEMARQLASAGETVASLALIDIQAPTVGDGRDASARGLTGMDADFASLGLFGSGDAIDPGLLAEFLADLGVGSAREARRLVAKLKAMDADSRRGRVLSLFGLDQVYQLDAGPERAGRLWDVLRANYLAGKRYSPGLYAGRATVFRASKRPGALVDPTLGWSSLVEGGVNVVTVPGDHASILRSPGVERLAESLRMMLGGAS